MIRVLVCGGRDYTNYKRLNQVLDIHNIATPFTVVIEGDAKGADRLAGQWARDRKIPLEVYPAEWKKYGNSAGPIRNQRMLEQGKPDLVIAFHGSSGTANMISKAKAAGIKVIEIDKSLETTA